MSSLLSLVTATQMNFYNNPPMLVVLQTVSQSPASSTFTKITYTSVVYDNYSGYNTGTSVYTVPVGGYYRMTYTVQWSANATPARLGGIQDDGNTVTYSTGNDAPTASGVTTSMGTSTILALNGASSGVPDTLNVFGDQNSGAGLATQVGTSNLTSYNSYFCVRWISNLPSY